MVHANVAVVASALVAVVGCGSSDKLTSPHGAGVGSANGGGATSGGAGGDSTGGLGGGGATSTGAGGGGTSTGAGGAAGGGTGSGGWTPGTGIFDADRMYVIGTLMPGQAGLDLFCDVLDPDHPSGGFPVLWAPAPAALQRNAYIRPIDGRLLYLSGGVVYTFVPDSLGAPPKPAAYPKHPFANDVVVPTPGCAPVTAFHVLTADGSVVYTCGDGEGWFDQVGDAYPTCAEPEGPLRIDDFGAQLCAGSVIDPAGVTHPRPASPGLVTVRARPYGGFWGVAVNGDGRFERWSVDHDGATTLEGAYAPMPAGLTKVNADVPGWAALDSIGNLYRWAMAIPNVDVVVRFSADLAGAAVVYDEATKPVCELHGFNFVASP